MGCAANDMPCVKHHIPQDNTVDASRPQQGTALQPLHARSQDLRSDGKVRHDVLMAVERPQHEPGKGLVDKNGRLVGLHPCGLSKSGFGTMVKNIAKDAHTVTVVGCETVKVFEDAAQLPSMHKLRHYVRKFIEYFFGEIWALIALGHRAGDAELNRTYNALGCDELNRMQVAVGRPLVEHCLNVGMMDLAKFTFDQNGVRELREGEALCALEN